jgi:hypothetical protein
MGSTMRTEIWPSGTGNESRMRYIFLVVYYLAVLTLSPEGYSTRALGLMAAFLVTEARVSEE